MHIVKAKLGHEVNTQILSVPGMDRIGIKGNEMMVF